MLWTSNRTRKTKMQPLYSKTVAYKHVKTKRKTDSDQITDNKTSSGNMNKHFKKKILEQHVRPPEVQQSNGVETEMCREQSNIASSRHSAADQHDDGVQKAASGDGGSCPNNLKNNGLKKRKKTCRSQFRHKDIEVYKLGSSTGEYF